MELKSRKLKICTTCKKRKSVSDFNKRSISNDGLAYVCRKCSSIYYKKNPVRYKKRATVWAKKNRKRRLEILKKSSAKNYERTLQYIKKKRILEPEKYKARNKLANGRRLGWVTVPDRCEDCGKKFPKHRIQGAHTDYSKPLDVRWLCQKCHYAFDNLNINQ